MPVGPLQPDLLYVLLLGPGYGESIAVRVPPNEWLVVDSLAFRGAPGASHPVVELLRRENANLVGLVLTHPHGDHAEGFVELVEYPVRDFIGAVPSYVDKFREWTDAEKQRRSGAVEAAVSAISDRWERFGSLRWETTVDSCRRVGTAEIRALHPTSKEAAQFGWPPGRDPNRIATPLLVCWDSLKLVLGADLPKAGWSRVLKRSAGLNEHDLLKVAHHGSSEAQHGALLASRGSPRCWVLAPWQNGGDALPRFDDEEGIATLLGFEAQVHMTTVRGRVQPAGHVVVSRQAVLAAKVTGMRARTHGQGVRTFGLGTPSTAAEAWIAAAFSRDGKLVELQHGNSAVTVVEAAGAPVRDRRARASRR